MSILSTTLASLQARIELAQKGEVSSATSATATASAASAAAAPITAKATATGAAKIDESLYKTFSECLDIFDKECAELNIRFKKETNIRKLDVKVYQTAINQLEENAQTIRRIAMIHLNIAVEDTLHPDIACRIYPQWSVRTLQEIRQKLDVIEFIKKIKESDQGFNSQWEKLEDSVTSNIIDRMHALVESFEWYVRTFKDNNPKLKDELFKAFLQIMLAAKDKVAILPIDETWKIFFSHCFFIKQFADNPKKTIALTQRIFGILPEMLTERQAHTILERQSNQLRSLYVGMLPAGTEMPEMPPIQPADILRMCQVVMGKAKAMFNAITEVVRSSDQLDEIEKRVDAFCKLDFSAIDLQVITHENAHLIPLCQKDPRAFEQICRLTKKTYGRDAAPNVRGKFHLFEAHCTAPEYYRAVIALLDHSDARIALNVLFRFGFPTQASELQYGNLRQSSFISELGKFFVWIDQQRKTVAIASSASSHSKPLKILDFIIALVLNKPIMAKRLLNLPRFELLEKILLHDQVVDVGDVTEDALSKILNECGEKDLAASMEMLSPNVEKQLQQMNIYEIKLLPALNAWLDQLLKNYNVKTESLAKDGIAQKLSKLPSSYRGILERMFLLAVTNDMRTSARILHQFVTFADKYPTSIALSKYLDSVHSFLSILPHHERAVRGISVLTDFHDLAVEFPHLLSRLFDTDMVFAPSYKQIMVEKGDQQFVDHLLRLHPGWLAENGVKQITDDDEIRKAFSQVMQSEFESGVSLIGIFSPFKRLKLSPLLEAVTKDPEFGYALQSRVSQIDAPLAADSFDKSGLETVPEYDYWQVLSESLQQRRAETVQMVKTLTVCADIFQNSIRLFSANKPIDLLAFAKIASPVHFHRMASLISWKQQELASKLMELHKTNSQLALSLLDMAYGGYHAEAAILLDRHQSKPNDPLTTKLLQLAGSVHGSLIRRVLELDPKHDEDLLNMFLNEPKEFPNLFRNLLVLRARKDEKFVDVVLKLYKIEKRMPVHNTVLQAVSEGRYLLAKELASSPTLMETTSPLPAPCRMQKYSELRRDWTALDKSGLKDTEKGVVEKELFPFIESYRMSCKEDKEYSALVGKVQFLLQHKPQRLFQILGKSNWQKDLNWDISQDLEEIVSSRVKGEEADKKDNDERGAKGLKQLSISMAELLVTPSGCMNCDLIESLTKLSCLTRILKFPMHGVHLRNALHLMGESVDFNERLNALTHVPKGTRQHEIIVELLNIKPTQTVSVREGRIAIVSALICPPRLGDYKTNFVATPLVQLASTSDGLLQILEYLLALLEKGSLVISKHTKDGKLVSERYRLACAKTNPIETKDRHFFWPMNTENDHNLYRALEETLSGTIPEKSKNLKSTFLESIEWHIRREVRLYPNFGSAASRAGQSVEPKYSDDNFISESPMHNVVFQTIMSEFRDNLGLIYRTAQIYSANDLGAWFLIDIDTGELLALKENEEKFFAKIIRLSKESLKEAYPASGKEFDAFFNCLPERLFHSDQFQESLWRHDYKFINSLSGLARVNPTKYSYLLPRTPFMEFGTNDPAKMLQSIYGSEARVLPTVYTQNPRKVYERYTQSLSDRELLVAKRNPNYMRVVANSYHCFNFTVNPALEVLSKEKPEDFWRVQQELMDKLENTPITEDMVKAIFDAFVERNRDEVKPFYTGPTRVKTLRHLCAFLYTSFQRVRGEINYWGFFEDVVDLALKKIPQFRDMLPKVDAMYTTVREHQHNMGFAKRVYSRDMKRVFENADDQFINWSPGDQWRLRFFLYKDSTDALERNYML